MWVRSQDKKRLVNVENFCICFEKEICSLSPINYGEETKRMWLGTYSTKEKAIKVLDKIQRYIINEIDIKPYSTEYSEEYNVIKEVFQMPKDDEVK